MASKTIALVICSTRTPRIGPSIAAWITSLIPQQTPPATRITLQTLDLADFPLPLSPAGTTIPAHQPLPLPLSPYDDEAVNAWSNAIRPCAAFIFLTPQYNWSLPGHLKVAFDALFHEWGAKPMLVVTYGGHGGGKCAVHVRDVWRGLRGGMCVGVVELALGGGEAMKRAQGRGKLVGEVVEGWLGEGKDGEVRKGWETLCAIVEEMDEGKF